MCPKADKGPLLVSARLCGAAAHAGDAPCGRARARVCALRGHTPAEPRGANTGAPLSSACCSCYKPHSPRAAAARALGDRHLHEHSLAPHEHGGGRRGVRRGHFCDGDGMFCRCRTTASNSEAKAGRACCACCAAPPCAPYARSAARLQQQQADARVRVQRHSRGCSAPPQMMRGGQARGASARPQRTTAPRAPCACAAAPPAAALVQRVCSAARRL
jgi:hypothetical protein